MNPKKVDVAGKGILAAAVAAVGYSLKKYGPQIAKVGGEVIKKMILRR